MDSRPVFCFQHIDRASKNPWAFTPNDKDAAVIFNLMIEMCGMTWRELQNQSRNGRARHHGQAVVSVTKEAQADLERLKVDDLLDDELFRFTAGSTRRLWGIRVGRVFHALWWDDQHLVCPTKKRNT